MRNSRHGIHTSIALALLLSGAELLARVPSAACNDLAPDASAAMALKYLDQDRQNLSSACILDAIRIIKVKNYKPAIPVLVKYLDFTIPPPQGIPTAIRLTQGPTNEVYPAADVLAAFGGAATPALKKVLVDQSASKVERINAAKALFYTTVKDRPQVIRFISKTSRLSQDPETGEELSNLASKLVRGCTAQQRQECEQAASDQ